MDTDLHQIIRSNQGLSEEHCQVSYTFLTYKLNDFPINESITNDKLVLILWFESICSTSCIRSFEGWNTYILQMLFIEIWNPAIFCWMQIVIWRSLISVLLDRLQRTSSWLNMWSPDGTGHLSCCWTLQSILLPLMCGRWVASLWSLWTESLCLPEKTRCIRCAWWLR